MIDLLTDLPIYRGIKREIRIARFIVLGKKKTFCKWFLDLIIWSVIYLAVILMMKKYLFFVDYMKLKQHQGGKVIVVISVDYIFRCLFIYDARISISYILFISLVNLLSNYFHRFRFSIGPTKSLTYITDIRTYLQTDPTSTMPKFIHCL